jgi:hypothetical protein
VIYSTRFYGGRPASSPLVLYTVPSGYVAVVRSVQLWVLTSGISVQLAIVATGSTIVQRLSASATDFTTYDLRAVLNVGESLEFVGGNGAHQVTVSGYLLTV